MGESGKKELRKTPEGKLRKGKWEKLGEERKKKRRVGRQEEETVSFGG